MVWREGGLLCGDMRETGGWGRERLRTRLPAAWGPKDPVLGRRVRAWLDALLSLYRSS